MKRSALPQRKAWPRRRSKSRYRTRVRDTDYMWWVKTQPCCRCGAPPPSECHHAGERAYGRKAPDSTCVPLCHYHHQTVALLDGWRDKAERRAFYDDQIAEHRSRYLASQGGL